MSITNEEERKRRELFMIHLMEDRLDMDTYMSLRKTAGFRRLTRDQARKALNNSLYTLVAYKDGAAVGMGRIVGDGAVICYVQDLIVLPQVRGQGIGSLILETLKDFVVNEGYEGTTMMFDLMCALGRESFYQKHGFISRPTKDLGPGMIQYIEIGSGKNSPPERRREVPPEKQKETFQDKTKTSGK